MKFHVIPYVPVRTGQGLVAEAPLWREGTGGGDRHGPPGEECRRPGAFVASAGTFRVRRGFVGGDGSLCLDIHEST